MIIINKAADGEFDGMKMIHVSSAVIPFCVTFSDHDMNALYSAQKIIFWSDDHM